MAGLIVAIVGSREFEDRPLVERIVIRLMARHPHLTVVSGGARGADSLAREVCRDLGFHLCGKDASDPGDLKHLPEPYHFAEIPAKWRRPDGSVDRGAGFRRNGTIVRHVETVIALFADGPRTGGTTNTVKQARSAGLPVFEYHEGRWT